MERITLLDLQALWEESAPPCISIYLPTHEKGPGTQADPIVLKNLARDAGAQLAGFDLRETDARALLAPVEAIVADQAFWKEQAPGLALFLSPHSFRALRLPQAPAERVVVTHRFHTRPLLYGLMNGSAFHVLAVSLNVVRLLRAGPQGLEEVALAGAPRDLKDFQKYEESQPDAQYRQAGQGGTYAAGGRQADLKDAQRRYLRAIAKALAKAAIQEPALAAAPLVFAGVEELFAQYREVADAANLLPRPIAGNADRLSAATLHELALAALRPLREAEQAGAAARYRQLAGTGRTASGLAPVLRAAHAGRVQVLLLRSEGERWGRFSVADGRVETRERPLPGDDELLDLAASLTVRSGGLVVPLPAELGAQAGMEDGLAALLRY